MLKKIGILFAIECLLWVLLIFTPFSALGLLSVNLTLCGLAGVVFYRHYRLALYASVEMVLFSCSLNMIIFSDTLSAVNEPLFTFTSMALITTEVIIAFTLLVHYYRYHHRASQVTY